MVFLCGLVFNFQVVYADETKTWMGEYVDRDIPGYEILSSGVIWKLTILSKNNGISNIMDELEKNCKDSGGIAMVNLRMTFSSYVMETKYEINVGDKVLMYSDCVTYVKPKK